MALSQSALSELLDAFRDGAGVDLIRESVHMVLQELIEAEAAERISAGRYERTDARLTERNGSRPKLVATQAGDVELRIPKLRKGSFFPIILEPRRRIDQALYAVVMEAYVQGISTRSVDDLAEAMGVVAGSFTTSASSPRHACRTTASSGTPRARASDRYAATDTSPCRSTGSSAAANSRSTTASSSARSSGTPGPIRGGSGSGTSTR